MYRTYIDSFDYHLWYNPALKNGPQKVKLIHITPEIKHALIELYESKCNNNKLSNNKLINTFKQQIEKNIDPCTKYFIKLSGTSGKNEKSINMFDNADEILKHLVSVKLFVDQEYKRTDKETYLILVKWDDKIDLRYEFRIFVVNNKITGISQQSKKLFNYSQEELETIEKALNNISFINELPYDTCILDVYIDMENCICNLIEINPFGAHCGAGASLFKWDDDYDLLNNNNLINNHIIEFRYLSIINI